MRALIGGTGTGTWELREHDLPTRLGALRIQVITAGLNRADLHALDGTYRAAGQADVAHVAHRTDDYQALYDRALAAGFTVGQEGRIGGEDGRFAHLETEHHPGTVIEISDVGGTKRFVFDIIRTASADRDGTQPIQEIDPLLLGGDPAATAEILEALG